MRDFELAEEEVLSAHQKSWTEQGYDVIRRPNRQHVPTFLKSYVPDAILVGRKPYIVVEVIHKGHARAESKIRELKGLLAGHDDWQLEVLYAGTEPHLLPEVPTENLKKALREVGELASVNSGGALLLLWASLEALTRRLEPSKTRRPQSPGRVVELLAGDGFIAPSEASKFREAVEWRNKLVHGDLGVVPSTEDIESLVEVAEKLVAVVEARESPGLGQ